MSYAQVPADVAVPVAIPLQPVAVEQEYALVTPPDPTREEFQSNVMNRRIEFNISKYVHEGWLFTKYNFWQFFGLILIMGLVSLGLYIGYIYAISYGHPEIYRRGDGQYEMDLEWDLHTVLISLAFVFGRAVLICFPVYASMYKAVFNAMRNNSKIRFADFFSCFACPYFFRLAGLALVLTTLSCMGFVFWPLVIPAFYFSVTSVFAVPLHVDQASFMSICKALMYSFKLFHRYFCSMIGFLFLLGCMQILGALCFGVGLFVTIPVGFTALCYCYHHLVGVNGVAVLVPLSHLEGVPAPASNVDATQVPVASAPSMV